MPKKSRLISKKKQERIRKEKPAVDVDFDKLIDSLRKENEMLRSIASFLERLEKNLDDSKKK
ncbi:MAG: hypothetical protein JSV96_18945 [Candidatus Aminicenantes bacterium]|nr:MAG: hypothetical protein JSV96_18945 [Candidatus Aminicenantes bacterium]